MRRGLVPTCFLVVFAASALVGVSGCKRDLGECNLDGQTEDGRPIDGPAAFDIAYRSTDGLPMYEGQALVQSTCGNGQFCHSPAAEGADRIGVPAGLNFDVALACTDASQDPTCTQPIASCDGGQTNTPYCDRLTGLHNNQNQVNNWADGMIQEIRAGAMPPGEAGTSVRDPIPWVSKSDGNFLPSIESSEGQDIVRNWLACQAPVIARTELPPSENLELTECASVDAETCIYNGPQGDLPDANWNDIYWSVMFTRCVICHGPANNNVDQNPDNPLDGQIPGGASADALAALNLTGTNVMDTTDWAIESYPAVVGALAANPGLCAGQGTLVVPSDSANSIFLQKVRGEQTCGTEMPPGQILGEPILQVIEEWIDLGAPEN